MINKTRVIKINSDGLPQSTIVSLEDGTEIAGVTAIYWRMDTHSKPEVELTIVGPASYLEGKLVSVEFKCPCCDMILNHTCGD